MKDKHDWTNYCATNNNRNQCLEENCTMFYICKIKNINVDVKAILQKEYDRH